MDYAHGGSVKSPSVCEPPRMPLPTELEARPVLKKLSGAPRAPARQKPVGDVDLERGIHRALALTPSK